MWYLLLLAAAGAILTLFYRLWIKIFGDQLTQWMKHVALIIVLLAHVIPLVGFKALYNKLLDGVLMGKACSLTDILVRMAAVRASSKRYITPYFALTLLLSAVWVVCFTRKFIELSVPYIKNVWYINRIYDQCCWDEALEMLERMRKKRPFRRKIRVMRVEEKRSPCTIGVFRPIIVLNGELKGKELEWTLRHELTHIARGDVAFKLLWQIVSCVFWFNPTLEDFTAQFSLLTEESCDEKVTDGFTEEERIQYIKLIAKNLSQKPSGILTSALSEDIGSVQKRINAMTDNIPERSPKKKLAAVIVFIIFMVADSLVALAYPDVYHVRDRVQEAKLLAEGKGVWTYGETDPEGEWRAYEVQSAAEFVDETGAIIPINMPQEQKGCVEHQWISGYVQIHRVNNVNGCTMEVYCGKCCINCHMVSISRLDVIHNYNKCPHVDPGL